MAKGKKTKKPQDEVLNEPDFDQSLEDIEAEAWGENNNKITTKSTAPTMVAKAVWCGIIGLGKVAAVASIVYTTYQVLTLTDDAFSKGAIIPQILLASIMAINAFVMTPIKLLMEKSKKSS